MKARHTASYSVKNCGLIKMAIHDVDTSKRIITGIGNAYNYLDSQLDVLQEGAASKSIAEMGPASSGVAKIKHALNHDLTMLPGKMITMDEREIEHNGKKVKGIYFESKLADTTLGNDTLINYQEGIYDNHSIGFKYLKYKFLDPSAHGNSEAGKEWSDFVQTVMNADEYEEIAKSLYDKSVLRVDEIKLFEISTVAFGANSLTPYLGNKAQSPESLSLMINNRIKKLHQTIKKGTQSDDMMNLISLQIAQLETALGEIFDDIDIKNFIRSKNNLPDNKEVNTEMKNNLQFNVFDKEFLSNITSKF